MACVWKPALAGSQRLYQTVPQRLLTKGTSHVPSRNVPKLQEKWELEEKHLVLGLLQGSELTWIP